MERRDALRSMLGGLAALGAAPLVASQNNADLTAAMSKLQLVTGGKINKTQGLASIGLDYKTLGPVAPDTSWIVAEIREIERFLHEKRLIDEREGHQTGVQGVSVPFATLPMNLYARLGAKHYEIAAPQIPVTQNHFLCGSGSALDPILLGLFTRRLATRRLPRSIMLVETIANKVPGIAKDVRVMADRTVSPRFTIDADEPEIKGHSWPHLIAMMLGSMAHGMADEMEAKYQTALNAVNSGPCASYRKGCYMAYKQPHVYIERRAYMLECFSYVLSGGTIYTLDPALA